MRRAAWVRILLTVTAVTLGIGLTLMGLYARLFGQFPDLPPWMGGWEIIPHALGLNLLTMAWPFLIVGLTWFGAVAGLWMQLSWGYPATLLLAALSSLTLGPATGLALVVVLCLWMTRAGKGQPTPSE